MNSRFKKINTVRIVFLNLGILFLIFSYLCFIYIIPGFEICGSACEFWWSWIIDLPKYADCIEMCIIRNELYKPFMIIGGISIICEIVFEVLNIMKKKNFLRDVN
ncbi:MAG: hypothetical protein ACFE9S_00540 [Candidatus Hermodarchaeota archaeon]